MTLPEVLKILEESKENIITNKKLIETSKELKEITSQLQTANENLVRKDKQKDEFLDTGYARITNANYSNSGGKRNFTR